jgi:hypothetical protein
MRKFKKHLKREKWYHGTTLEGWKQLCNDKIDVKYNIGNELDFGFGFYLTQQQVQAENYTKNIIKFRKEERQKLGLFSSLIFQNNEDEIPVVIEFGLNPIVLYESGNYEIQIYDSYNDDFAEFVFHNRLHNIVGQSQHKNDVIYGVVSDSLPMLLITSYKLKQITKDKVIEGLKKSTRDTQLSIHNQEICDKMKVTKVYLVETGEELNVDDYNY